MVMRKTSAPDTFSDSGSWVAPAAAAKWQQSRTVKKIRIATRVSRSSFSIAGQATFGCARNYARSWRGGTRVQSGPQEMSRDTGARVAVVPAARSTFLKKKKDLGKSF